MKKSRKDTRVSPRAFSVAPPAGPEVSPVDCLSAADFVARLSPSGLRVVDGIRRQKRAATRPRPSARLVGEGGLVPWGQAARGQLLDAVAALVDQNVFGRSEMCLQFASLLVKALRHLGYDAVAVASADARYLRVDRTWATWRHAWVEAGEVLIDGNADSFSENPTLGGVDVAAFWGHGERLPADRTLPAGCPLAPGETDTAEVLSWWEDLRRWLDEQQDLPAKGPFQSA